MLTFDLLKQSWQRFLKSRERDIRAREPNFTNPNEVYMKLLKEDEVNLTLQFLGFENAVEQSSYIPQAKRLIVTWLKQLSMSVQTQRGAPNTLVVIISKEMKFGESFNFTQNEKSAAKIVVESEADRKYERVLKHGLTSIVVVREN